MDDDVPCHDPDNFNERTDLKIDPLALLQRMKVWRLWLFSVILSVLLSEAIVSVMGLLLKGEVPPDYLITGLVTSYFVASLVVAIVAYFLEKLAESELKLRAIIEADPECVKLLAADGTLLQINRAGLDMVEATSEDQVIGKSVLEIVEPAYQDDFIALLKRVFMGGSGSLEFEIRGLRGGLRWVDTHAVPLRNAQGVIIAQLGVTRDITQRKQAEQALEAINEHLTSLVEAIPDSIFFKDGAGRWLITNQPARQLFHLHGIPWQGKVEAELAELQPELRAAHESCQLDDEKAWKAGKLTLFDERIVTEDGKQHEFEVRKLPIFSDDGQRKAMVIIGRDVTNYRQAEEKLQLAASVFTHAREGIFITDTNGLIIDVNDAFSRITDYGRDEVLGRNLRILRSGRHNKAFFAALWRDLVEKGYWYGEIWNRRKNGDVYAVMQTISAVRDAQGNTQQYVALFSDITALKEHENQLEHVAHYDTLTGLPNRVLLADRLHQAITQVPRRGESLAVVFLDLDGFKTINDNHGHAAGDQLLISVATRMKHALREGDTLARLGGDEFVAVLLDLDGIEASVPMLTRLLAAAAQPVHVGDLVLQVTASLGVTFYPQAEEVDADQLLRQADQAMYQAKLAGRNRYQVFDAEQDRSVRGHNESLDLIRHALIEREFVLYYQPKVNMRTGVVVGAEALIRWQHPEKGLLPPVEFLPMIEAHPLAIEVGEWVIDTTLAQMGIWQAAGLNIPVSVNIVALQLQQENFVKRLHEILAAHPDVRTNSLELEILETSALQDVAQVFKIIKACKEIGVDFALDDFGTGYSSLTYLKRLPVTLLKIDQSFVRDMLDDPDDLAILEGVISLAAAFRLQVIAEGVETMEHGAVLLQLGCELAQGYGIARPMLAHELPGWLAAWRPDPAWACQPVLDDLTMLYAAVDHRAWIAAIANYIKGEHEMPPPQDYHQCRFGTWLDAEHRASHGTQLPYQAIELLHLQAHALATELLELKAQGRNAEALARLGELHDLSNDLLKELKTLMLKIE